MNLSNIAKTVLANQNTFTGGVNVFAIREALTEAEYDEMMWHRWVERREDGCYYVPSRVSALEELKEAAQTADFGTAEVVQPVTPSFYRRFVEADTQAPGVGDQVVVVEAGKTYAATVQGQNQDGTYKLSFSGDMRPSRDTFSKDELGAVASTPPPAPGTVTPGPVATPAPTAAKPTSPVAPGISARS